MKPLTRKEFFLDAIAEGTPTPPPLTREERYLAKIAENTGGDSLPPIEEGDDGKVLTASDGEAVWASGGGGGGGGSVTKVTMTYDENDGSFTLNEEAATIFSACSNGVVLATLTMGPVEACFQIVNAFTRPAIDDPGNIYAFVTYDVTLQGFMTFQAIADDEYPVYTP